MISFRNVSFSYNDENKIDVLKDINLSIISGEVVVLCGESGCGKSTITRLINGLAPRFYEGEVKGTIEINSEDISKKTLYDISEDVGSVFQNPKTQFFNVDTNSEIVFGCENLGMKEEEIKSKFNKVVKEFKIDKLMNRSIFKLSGGEKQKIACASVSATEPSIMVLDEPSSNLDMKGIEELRKVIEFWKSKGKTTIIAEHRLYYLRNLADRYVYIKNGQIKKEFSSSEMIRFSNEELEEMGLRPFSLTKSYKEDSKSSLAHNIMKINHLNFSYSKKEKQIINISNVLIRKGSITGIVGNNGAGKSTFANCLCGLNKNTKCKVTIFNDDSTCNIYTKNKERLAKFYMVKQDVNHQLFTESVLGEVLVSMQEKSQEKAMEILRLLDLDKYAHSHPMSLSGGQKQRVAIASSLASNREILIFDEPTSGLDMKHMIELSNLFKKLRIAGKTVLVITHDLEFLLKCATDIMHIENGTLKDQYTMNKDNNYRLFDFFKQNV